MSEPDYIMKYMNRVARAYEQRPSYFQSRMLNQRSEPSAGHESIEIRINDAPLAGHWVRLGCRNDKVVLRWRWHRL